MKILLKIEELAMLALGIVLFSFLDFSWWLFPALILLPDLSMAGYLIDNEKGAFLYNIFHHKGVAILIYGLGLLFNEPALQLAGIILFSHACMDRMFGYGLKHADSFSHTHLGWIGKEHPEKRVVE